MLIPAGSTSRLIDVFVPDSTSASGAGLTGLVYNSSGLTAYYHRSNASSATAISLATMTVGTWATAGFKEIDATNMPGWYQLGIPDAALASGAKYVTLHLQGAANMVPSGVVIELAAIEDAMWDALQSSHTTAGTFGGALQNDYDADIDVRKNDTAATDQWAVRFFKNGAALTSGITSPTLTVKRRSDGATLISAVTLTAALGTGDYYYAPSSSERITAGVEYEATVTATIDSATRTIMRLKGRDV